MKSGNKRAGQAVSKEKISEIEFSNIDLEFLTRYSIEKQNNENIILNDIGADSCKITDFTRHINMSKRRNRIFRIFMKDLK